MSSNDHLVDCVLKWKIYIAPYFMRKEAKVLKAVIRVSVGINELTSEKINKMLYSQKDTH